MKNCLTKNTIIFVITLLLVACSFLCACDEDSQKTEVSEPNYGIIVTENDNAEFSGVTIDTKEGDSESEGRSGLWNSIVSGFNSTFMDKSNSEQLLRGLLMTIFLIVTSLSVGFLIGWLMFLLEYFGNDFFAKLLTKIMWLFSLMPVSAWLLICFYLIFPEESETGYLVAIFGLSISFSFQVFGCFSSALNSIPAGEREAAITMGYTKGKALKKIILPQMFPKVLSSLESETVYHIRDTSLVGFIAVQDIQAVADAISTKTGEPFFPILLTAIVYMLLCFTVSSLIKVLRKKLFPDVVDTKRLERKVRKGVKND